MLRARFNDARFFWQTDQKHPLRERLELLKHVTFQKDLGSYYDKTMRCSGCASWLCGNRSSRRDRGPSRRGSQSRLPGEGRSHHRTGEGVYRTAGNRGRAVRAGAGTGRESARTTSGSAIATAIYDHYKPESMDDAVPRTVEGAVLSIADKADTIAGMFALGLQPSGSKDPFALRRQANGIVKTIAEHKLPLQSERICSRMREAAIEGPRPRQKFAANVDYGEAVQLFFRERLEFYLRDVRGFSV